MAKGDKVKGNIKKGLSKSTYQPQTVHFHFEKNIHFSVRIETQKCLGTVDTRRPHCGADSAEGEEMHVPTQSQYFS